MRYMIREKFFHLGEDSTIMDEAGQPLFEVDDRTFSESGQVGLWTKADSVTLFDKFSYEAKK